MHFGRTCRRGRRRSRGSPPWRNSGVRQDPSDEPDGLEHANHTARPSRGSAAVTPSMRAGMPADHDAARTGDLPVSAEVRQLSRSGMSLPHCRRASADPDVGAPTPSPAQHAPWGGTSCSACQSRRKRERSHPDALRQDLPARAPALPGKPALAYLRCPPRFVSRTGWTGTRQRRPVRLGEALP
jgi:hypothetical protein